MKKYLFATILSMSLVFSLAACGGKKEDKKEDKKTEASQNDASSQQEIVDTSDLNLDVAFLADTIKSECDFKDDLSPIDSTVGLSRLLNINDTSIIENASFYTNSSATAEEIIVIKTTAPEHVQTVLDAFDARIEAQKEACKDYLPDETPKLESAVKYTSGQYVILVISNNNEGAENLIKQYL